MMLSIFLLIKIRKSLIYRRQFVFFTIVYFKCAAVAVIVLDYAFAHSRRFRCDMADERKFRKCCVPFMFYSNGNKHVNENSITKINMITHH